MEFSFTLFHKIKVTVSLFDVDASDKTIKVGIEAGWSSHVVALVLGYSWGVAT